MLRRIVLELRGAAVQSYVDMWCLVVGHETTLRRIVLELRGAAVQSYVGIYGVLMGWGGA